MLWRSTLVEMRSLLAPLELVDLHHRVRLIRLHIMHALLMLLVVLHHRGSWLLGRILVERLHSMLLLLEPLWRLLVVLLEII